MSTTMGPPVRRALLIDVEHLARPRGPLASAAVVRRRLEQVLAEAGPVSYLTAVAVSSVLERYLSALLALRVPLAVAPRGPSGVQRLLDDRAQHLRRVGYEVTVCGRAGMAGEDAL